MADINAKDVKSTVLIVDDDLTNIKVLAKILKDQHKIVVAKGGTEALELISESVLPDLILLDVVMPEMNGYDVCEQIKKTPETEHIPIIFVTAKDAIDEETKGLRMGAVDYISKPFSPEIVKARVANHIELKQKRDLLAQLNITDGLTGIANRRRFDDYLDQVWRSHGRSSSPLSLLMVDVDYFKPFNDHYGHTFGDECLKKIAAALNETVFRSNDLVARYGGEEFSVILPNCEKDGGQDIAERMRTNILELAIPHAQSKTQSVVTASFGVAACRPSHRESIVSFVEKADSALYQAKQQGRNRVVGFER